MWEMLPCYPRRRRSFGSLSIAGMQVTLAGKLRLSIRKAPQRCILYLVSEGSKVVFVGTDGRCEQHELVTHTRHEWRPDQLASVWSARARRRADDRPMFTAALLAHTSFVVV
jgi:hypothetical protein